MPILVGNDPKQLSLSVRVQSPRVAVKCEEREPVELFIQPSRVLVLFVVNGRLLFKVHILVQGVVVKF